MISWARGSLFGDHIGMAALFGESLESIMARTGEERIPTFVKQTLGVLNSKGG